MSRQSWSQTFRLILLIDSAVLTVKFFLSIWLIVCGAQLLNRYNQQEVHYDNSNLTLFVVALYFIGGISLLILVLIRWVLNFSQYRNENRIVVSTSSPNCNPSICRFCSSCSWFFFGIFHLGLTAIMIVFDWTEGRWLRVVAIIMMSWEYPIFGFVITYKWIFRKEIPERTQKFEKAETIELTETILPTETVQLTVKM